MTDDRKVLDKLVSERKKLDRQIIGITFREDGNSYGSLLSDAIYDIIRHNISLYNGGKQGKLETYKIYQKIHLSVSKEIGFKTKTITKQEYGLALSFLHSRYDF